MLNRILNSKLYLVVQFHLLIIIASTNAILSQEPPSIISVSYSSIPLKQVINDLQQTNQIYFAYSSRRIPLDALVTYSCIDLPTEQALVELFKTVGVNCRKVEKHWVLQQISNEHIALEPLAEVEQSRISGTIVDAFTGEVLIGATIFIPGLQTGAITNAYGYFSFTYAKGSYAAQVSYIGYQVKTLTLSDTSSEKMNIALIPLASSIQEVVIALVEEKEFVLKRYAAQSNIDPLKARAKASVMGESDVLRSMENIPGINFHSDGSSFFYVRGGGKDQNLILLDEAPIYNPSHLFGLFTPIIPQAVNKVDVYKSNFPIEYGGRLSSVVDVRMRDGNSEHFAGHVGIGLLASRVNAEGPLFGKSGSYFFAYRRSQVGALLKAVEPSVQDVFFSDFTGKMNTRIGQHDRIYLTFYKGNDVYLNKPDDKTEGIQWENLTGTLRWNHIYNDKVFTNTTLLYSTYNYYLHTDKEKGKSWNSSIENLSIRSEGTYYPIRETRLKFGVQLGVYNFNPGNYTGEDLPTSLQVSKVESGEYIAYTGVEQKIGRNISLNYGIRATYWANYGEAFSIEYDGNVPVSKHEYADGERYYGKLMPEPRMALSIKTGKLAAVKASYNRTIQHINLLSNTSGPFNSLDVFIPSGPNIEPSCADNLNLGYVISPEKVGIVFETDMYYRWLYNQIAYAPHANLLLNPAIEGEIRQGEGRAYGVEFNLKRERGKLNFDISYAYARSFMWIAALNQGKDFPTHQDRPHSFSLAITYQPVPRLLIGGNYSFASGMPFTSPNGFYTYQGYQVPVYTSMNNQRLPAYKRLDTSIDFRLNKMKGRVGHHLAFSVFNMLNTTNPIYINFTKSYNEETNQWVVPADRLATPNAEPSVRFMYSVIPSLTYYIDF